MEQKNGNAERRMTMADEEKLIKLREAAALIAEAIKDMQKARKLFKKCGIEFCGGLDFNHINPWDIGAHLQIYKGINKFEKLIGAKAYLKEDIITGKPDTSRKYLDYKGLVFVQLGQERTSSRAKFTFR